MIAAAFAGKRCTPAALVASHGPFTWGKDPAEAVYHAVVLEEVARMAAYTNLHCSLHVCLLHRVWLVNIFNVSMVKMLIMDKKSNKSRNEKAKK